MSRSGSTTSRAFFEDMYRTTPDPWSFASSPYELHRYDTVLAHVPPGRFERAFEPGCSIGVLTAQLAPRCGFVTAIDIADTAVRAARRRCRDLGNVDVHRGSLPEDLPPGPFDLVVFSEIGYYFDNSGLASLALSIASVINADGQFLAVHWTGSSEDHVLAGTRVHKILGECLPMDHVDSERFASEHHGGFVLDVWRRTATDG